MSPPAPRALPSPPLRCWRSLSPLPAARSIWDHGDRTRTSHRPIEQKPTGTISGQGIGDAQGYATRGQALAKSGKAEEALAEFDTRARTRSLQRAGPVRPRPDLSGEKKHQQAIEDFTAANGLTPQQIEPLLARATSYLALDKAKEAASDLDEAVQADPNNAPAWSARGAHL